ncbi:uncharacterized protein LOC124859876 isoform X2 [Girardinichthys multiradiatus]|uniref:uncharacterized protein LOC124859876 isoform X2 n=1 Tax=Girardinichthys multiradiatus TaxID=208333 RepID=UPI001FACDD55|nr:uncharacterized protein LOC124859876 isoform X2 [Girardinichthys multiradiatus]
MITVIQLDCDAKKMNTEKSNRISSVQKTPSPYYMYKPQFTFLPGTNHLRLQASSDAAAAAQQERRDSSGREKLPVKSTQEVEAAAQRRVRALGGDPTDRRCILSQMEVQFGLYRGHTFQWLLTHDLGYTVGLLASHEAECEAGHGSSSSPLLCNKDALLEYARLFKEVTAAIVDKRRTGTDLEGDRLVGFGEYSTLTYRELYESSDPQISSYRGWIRGMQVQHAGSRLSQLKKYAPRRDRAQQPAASSAASTRSPAACSSRAGSKASCTTKAAAPSPQRQSSTPRKKRAMVLYSSSEEDEELMVEAASAVEQELSALATSSATPTPLLTPSPSADKPSAPAARVGFKRLFEARSCFFLICSSSLVTAPGLLRLCRLLFFFFCYADSAVGAHLPDWLPGDCWKAAVPLDQQRIASQSDANEAHLQHIKCSSEHSPSGAACRKRFCSAVPHLWCFQLLWAVLENFLSCLFC